MGKNTQIGHHRLLATQYEEEIQLYHDNCRLRQLSAPFLRPLTRTLKRLWSIMKNCRRVKGTPKRVLRRVSQIHLKYGKYITKAAIAFDKSHTMEVTNEVMAEVRCNEYENRTVHRSS
jgi:hypothetical protein